MKENKTKKQETIKEKPIVKITIGDETAVEEGKQDVVVCFAFQKDKGGVREQGIIYGNKLDLFQLLVQGFKDGPEIVEITKMALCYVGQNSSPFGELLEGLKDRVGEADDEPAN